MSEYCANCDTAITLGGILKNSNQRRLESEVEFVNFFNKAEYKELCDSCGNDIIVQVIYEIDKQIEQCDSQFRELILYFPLITLSQIPTGAEFRILNLVTANVTVGTGFFNEISQGVSDLFGAVSTNTGMSYKINSGELTARSIIVTKALNMGANCVYGVDIDYGTTANNSAMVSIQGTAVFSTDLEQILDRNIASKVEELREAYLRLIQLHQWRKGDSTA